MRYTDWQPASMGNPAPQREIEHLSFPLILTTAFVMEMKPKLDLSFNHLQAPENQAKICSDANLKLHIPESLVCAQFLTKFHPFFHVRNVSWYGEQSCSQRRPLQGRGQNWIK